MLEFLVVMAVLLGAAAMFLGAVLLFKKFGWSMKYLWTIPVVVLLGLGVWWSISLLGPSTAPPVAPSSPGWSLQAPEPKTVWAFFKDYWLWVALVLTAIYFAHKLTESKLAVAGKYAAIAIAVIMFGAMAVHGIWSEESPSQQVTRSEQAQSDCTARSPCTPVLKSDGSTEVVQGKSGFGICFDSSFWTNLSRFGYHITYAGVEKKYECTREQVLAGNCSQTSFDAFRFVPETGVSLPKYWFATKGINC